MKKLIVLLAIAPLLTTGCNRAPVRSTNLIGSWRFDAPTAKSLIFTFNPDNTYTIISMAIAAASPANGA